VEELPHVEASGQPGQVPEGQGVPAAQPVRPESCIPGAPEKVGGRALCVRCFEQRKVGRASLLAPPPSGAPYFCGIPSREVGRPAPGKLAAEGRGMQTPCAGLPIHALHVRLAPLYIAAAA